MKIKHIALVALTALALGLASVGVGAPALAGAKPGLLSGSNSASLRAGQGDFRSDAGGPASAASRPSSGGDIDPAVGGPAIAGSKLGIASGTNNA